MSPNFQVNIGMLSVCLVEQITKMPCSSLTKSRVTLLGFSSPIGRSFWLDTYAVGTWRNKIIIPKKGKEEEEGREKREVLELF
jgi:hypothetical protein